MVNKLKGKLPSVILCYDLKETSFSNKKYTALKQEPLPQYLVRLTHVSQLVSASNVDYGYSYNLIQVKNPVILNHLPNVRGLKQTNKQKNKL